MTRQSRIARVLERLGGSGEIPAPLTPLLDDHLAVVAGGQQCGYSSTCNHRSTSSGSSHNSNTQCAQ